VTRILWAVSWLTACAPGIAANRVTSSEAIIYITSNVRDAQVYVDGRFIAPLDALAGGVAVAPGTHRLELRHDDYFSTYLEVQLARSMRKKLAIDLAAMLP
jgi:hypothetical protein